LKSTLLFFHVPGEAKESLTHRDTIVKSTGQINRVQTVYPPPLSDNTTDTPVCHGMCTDLRNDGPYRIVSNGLREQSGRNV